MKTTFLNCSKDGRKALRENGRKSMLSRAEDFNFYRMHAYCREDVPEWRRQEKLALKHSAGKTVEDVFNSIGDWWDYGLSIDYVAPGTFEEQNEGYLRYQLSYGGPSDELRFYFSPGAKAPYKIVYAYLEWGKGVGFDVTGEEWAIWVWDQFYEVGTVENEVNKALS